MLLPVIEERLKSGKERGIINIRGMVPLIDSPSSEYKGRLMIELSFPIPFHRLELHPFHLRNSDEASLFPAIYINKYVVNIVILFFLKYLQYE